MFTDAQRAQAIALLAQCRAAGVRIVTAESCTGGLIAALLTDIPGSSEVLERGFVTYSNDAKHENLGVDSALIAHHGAVSGEVAGAMAQGALTHAHADMAIAVTGIAGPGGGSEKKPVGLVYIAMALRNGPLQVEECHLSGDRTMIRQKALEQALEMMLKVSRSVAVKSG